MEVQFELNGKPVHTEIEAGAVLLDVLRDLGCYSVKCGCETTNCGLCTVWVDGTPRLSCSILAAGISGRKITTLEGLQEEAAGSEHIWRQKGQSSVDTVLLDLS